VLFADGVCFWGDNIKNYSPLAILEYFFSLFLSTLTHVRRVSSVLWLESFTIICFLLLI